MLREYVIPVLRTTTDRWITFAVGFIALDVFVPWLAHQFQPNAGPVFLPIHFFVFMAALLLGWRAGLTVGLLSPLISFGLSGLPPLAILPQLTVEIATYGLVAGFLQERYRPNLWASLVMAMVVGRLALGLTAYLFSAGQANPLAVIQGVILTGWPGIVIQFVLLPPLVRQLADFLRPRLS